MAKTQVLKRYWANTHTTVLTKVNKENQAVRTQRLSGMVKGYTVGLGIDYCKNCLLFVSDMHFIKEIT